MSDLDPSDIGAIGAMIVVRDELNRRRDQKLKVEEAEVERAVRRADTDPTYCIRWDPRFGRGPYPDLWQACRVCRETMYDAGKNGGLFDQGWECDWRPRGHVRIIPPEVFRAEQSRQQRRVWIVRAVLLGTVAGGIVLSLQFGPGWFFVALVICVVIAWVDWRTDHS